MVEVVPFLGVENSKRYVVYSNGTVDSSWNQLILAEAAFELMIEGGNRNVELFDVLFQVSLYKINLGAVDWAKEGF